MSSTIAKTWVRVRVTDPTLKTMKLRAAGHGVSESTYANSIFHYLWRERRLMRVPSGSDVPRWEDLYFPVRVTWATRQRLQGISEEHQWNLAAFCGILIGNFLAEFDKDPRDLWLIYQVSARLEHQEILSDTDLAAALHQSGGIAGSNLSAGYLARWLLTRLKPLSRQIQIEGRAVELTPNLLEQILKRIQ